MPGGTGTPSRSACPRPTAFEPNSFSSSAFSSGTTCFIRAPSLRPRRRRRAPALRRRCAGSPSRVPTTPGIPYSRATIAEWDRRPPLSVTIAPSRGRRMLKASVVEFGDEDVALDDPVELVGTGNSPRRPLVDAPARREPAQGRPLVGRLGAAEQRLRGRRRSPASCAPRPAAARTCPAAEAAEGRARVERLSPGASPGIGRALQARPRRARPRRAEARTSRRSRRRRNGCRRESAPWPRAGFRPRARRGASARMPRCR